MERWTPLVLRELLTGSRRFNEIQRGVPLMSPSLLSKRLTNLRSIGVIEKRTVDGHVEYRLTESGAELRPIIEQLGLWGERWVRKLRRDDLDPALLCWDMRRNVVLEALPEKRTVVRFEFRGVSAAKRYWWFVLDRKDVDLCLLDPGHKIDLDVVVGIKTMIEIWMGDETFRAAIRADELRLDGPVALKRAFPKWWRRSAYADVTSAR